MSELLTYLQESPAITGYLGSPGDPLLDTLRGSVAITPIKSDNLLTVYLNYGGTEVVEAHHPEVYNEPVITKIVLNQVDVVYWGDHPLYTLVEDAIEEGELPEDVEAEAIPASLEALAEEMLKDYIEESIGEMADQPVIVTGESRSYSSMGGWVVTVRLSKPVSVAYSTELGQVKARTIATAA